MDNYTKIVDGLSITNTIHVETLPETGASKNLSGYGVVIIGLMKLMINESIFRKNQEY